MAQTLIIGYGNPTRSDDGLGWHAAQRLSETVKDDSVQILTKQQLTLDLAEQIGEADLVIFIDACTGEAPGILRCRHVAPDVTPPPTLSHHMSPSTLMACTRILYGRCPVALLFSVTGESFEFGEGLSPKVRTVLPLLLESVNGVVAGACLKSI